MRYALTWLLAAAAAGCAPAAIQLPPPEALGTPLAGPAVSLTYPIDARPASERRDGGYYVTSIPLPIVMYGAVNITPTPLEQVDRAVRIGLANEGIPVRPDGDLQIRVFVLHHVGIFDISDAQWVSTLTGGLAGTVGKFLYPVFATVEGQWRLEISDARGEVLAVRDVRAFTVRRLPQALTWGVWSLWRLDRVADRFSSAFQEVQASLAEDTAAIVQETMRGEAPTSGIPATLAAHYALHDDWTRADTFDLRDTDLEDEFALAKYGSARFSLMTGHDTKKGDVVGQLGIGGETLGYEVGLLDDAQLHLDVTVLGLVNQAEVGLRVQVATVGPTRFSVEETLGAAVTALPADRFRPRFAAMYGETNALVSHRPRELTWFYGAGVTYGLATASLDVDDDGANDIVPGRIFGIHTGPGAELQVTPTALIAFRLNAAAQFQGGGVLSLGPLGPLALVPQISLGLR